MNTRQLHLIIELQSKKANEASQQYQRARNFQSEQQQRLSDLENYRLSYLKQIKQKVINGAQASELLQYQNFVAKLDKACQQQIQQINQAVLVVAQRKQQYLAQQQKLDILKKYRVQVQRKHAIESERKEQKFMDEMASQAFLNAPSRAYR